MPEQETTQTTPAQPELMKFVFKTADESHTSSWSKSFAKVGDKYLNWKDASKAESIEKDTHSRWWLGEFMLPAGTIIHVEVKGANGPRGVNKFKFIADYRLDPEAGVLELTPTMGNGDGFIKGRLVLVKDYVQSDKAKNDINTKEVF